MLGLRRSFVAVRLVPRALTRHLCQELEGSSYDRLNKLLVEAGQAHHFEKFADQKIDFFSFIHLKNEDFIALNIEDEDTRKKLMTVIKEFKEVQKKASPLIEVEENYMEMISDKFWQLLGENEETKLEEIQKPTKYPIVLCHGVGGSKPLVPYFYSIARDFQQAGCSIYKWNTERYGSIENRAKSLQRKVENLMLHKHVKKINFIGHSMGGLDCRYYISKLGGHKYTASLTTIGTPHRGSCWADLMLSFVHDSVVPPAYKNLTNEYLAQFNKEVPDRPKVDYYSVVCEKTLPWNSSLYIPYKYILWKEGKNDGLVSAKSQEWGTVIERASLDHLEQHFSAGGRNLYRKIANHLSANNH